MGRTRHKGASRLSRRSREPGFRYVKHVEEHAAAATQFALYGLGCILIDSMRMARRASRITDWNDSDLDSFCSKPLD